MSAKIKKILLPIDFSQKSTKLNDSAFDLAKQNGAGLVGLYVLPFHPVQAYHPDRAAQEKMLADAKKFLEKQKKAAVKKGILFQSKILKGSPGRAIVDFASNKKNKIDIIVISSQNMGTVKEKFLGSVANHVVHKSSVPVFLVK